MKEFKRSKRIQAYLAYRAKLRRWVAGVTNDVEATVSILALSGDMTDGNDNLITTEGDPLVLAGDQNG